MNDELLTVKAVAEKTGRCKETIRRWISSGQLQASRVGKHGQFLVKERDLDQCLAYKAKITDASDAA